MINVVFVNKSTQKATSVKMDYIASPQSNCTVMDIEGDDPKFRECTIWKEGSVTSAPEISKFAADNKTTFDAYVCNGVEKKTVDEFWLEFAASEEEDDDEEKEEEERGDEGEDGQDEGGGGSAAGGGGGEQGEAGSGE